MSLVKVLSLHQNDRAMAGRKIGDRDSGSFQHAIKAAPLNMRR